MYLFSLYTIFIFVFDTQHLHCGASNCAYTIDGNSIDLSLISGDTIEFTDGYWNYYYTPCSDGLTCTDKDGVPQSAMSDQYKLSNDFCTAYLALWTDVTPTYSNGTFTFIWKNGRSSGKCIDGRIFIVKWSCGAEKYQVTSVEISAGCNYTMSIKSSLACQNSNNNTCVFMNEDKTATLDLTSLEGAMIEATDGDWMYYYTPCTNGLICIDSDGTSVLSMATQYKRVNTHCSAYLAIDDGNDVTLKYENSTFLLTYTNGQVSNECQELRIFVKCDLCNIGRFFL